MADDTPVPAPPTAAHGGGPSTIPSAAPGQAGDVPGVPGVPGSAVAGVVLGVVGVLTSFAVLPGLICGGAAALLARRAADLTGPDTGRPGRGYAVTANLLAGTALVLSAVVGGWYALGVMDSHTRVPSRSSQNRTQLRGLHQGMYIYSNSNKEHFPGLDSKGNIILNSVNNTGNSGDGDTVEARYWIMLSDDFFWPAYAISPNEPDKRITEYNPGTRPTQVPVEFNATTVHYSYAMLSINGTPGQPPDAAGRADEWTQTYNTQAIVVADRNTGQNATAGVQSIHTSSAGLWEGHVLWNDNHVAFEQTHILETRYGNGPLNVDAQHNGNDNLFAPAGDHDAFLIHRGD